MITSYMVVTWHFQALKESTTSDSQIQSIQIIAQTQDTGETDFYYLSTMWATCPWILSLSMDNLLNPGLVCHTVNTYTLETVV